MVIMRGIELDLPLIIADGFWVAIRHVPVNILGVLFLSSCAVGPLINGDSARSLDRGEYRLDSTLVGYSDSSGEGVVFTPMLRFSYGLTPTWDTGFQTELKTMTLTSKYTFIDSKKEAGVSLAALLGLVYAGSELSYFGGGILSYLVRGVEPYLALRYNLVNYDREFFDAAFFEEPPDLHFGFVSANFGFLYWWTESVAWGGEVVAWSSSSLATKRSTMASFQISFLF